MNTNQFMMRLAGLLLLILGGTPRLSALEVKDLRCEYLAAPLGLDTTRPRLSWLVESDRRGERQTGWQVLVASSPDRLAGHEGDLWDSGRVSGDQSIQVEYAGKPLAAGSDCHWKVRLWDRDGHASAWSAPARFSVGLLAADDWKGRWIGTASTDEHAEPWFRKTFALARKPRTALAYVGSIGFHELHVNGRKVDDRVLAPSVSHLTKRALYVTYDIAEYLQPGTNVVAVWLSPGWSLFKGVNPVMDFQLPKRPLFIAQLDLRDGDAAPTVVASDETWRCRPSHERHLGEWTNGNFGGDRIDATQELPRWDDAALDDSAWERAAPCEVRRLLSPDLVEPNRLGEAIRPVGVIRKGPRTYQVDLGRLFTGWVEARLKGAAGSTVIVTASTESNKACEFNQRDEYVIGAAGAGVFRNHFAYHEWRYATLDGVDAPPALTDIVGYRVGNDLRRTGGFECSSELLTRIYDATLNNVRNLTTGGMIVDCPHRERLGYGGDGHTSLDANLGNLACGPFYSKWARDWCDIQQEDGYIAHTAPTVDGGGGPAWSGFVVLMPWEVYQTYGDRRVLESSYPHMKRWLEFLRTKCDADGLLVPYGGRWGFLGDWITPHGNEESDSNEARLFNDCYRLLATRTAARVARVLGEAGDATAFEAQAEGMRSTLNKRFFDAARNVYLDSRQTHLVMPLVSGAVPDDRVEAVRANLRREILVTQQGHLDTGLHGTFFMTRYLSGHDANDLVYSYASRTNFPGYGHFIAQGYDTWPENWRGGGSKIHGCYNGIGGWFLQGLAGIRADPAAPGYQRILIKPSLVGDLTWVRAHFDSMHGRIISNWNRDGGKIRMEVVIPANTSATIYVPARNEATVRESGKPAAQADGVRFLRMEKDAALYEVGSGTYAFASEIERQ